jgi:hypothetical protein
MEYREKDIHSLSLLQEAPQYFTITEKNGRYFLVFYELKNSSHKDLAVSIEFTDLDDMQGFIKTMESQLNS